jgi:predicted transcriptional regulator
MSNKEELLEAIEHYSVFTKTQRKILKSLTEIEIDGKAIVDVNTLAKVVKTSATAVYNAIKLFEKDNILQVLPSANKKMNSFLIKRARLEEIKEISTRMMKLK